MMKTAIGVLMFLSVFGLLSAQPFNMMYLMTTFGGNVQLVANTFSTLQVSSNAIAQCTTPDLNAALLEAYLCILAEYPIPDWIVNQIWSPLSFSYCVCELPPASNAEAQTVIAFTLDGGSDFCSECPAGYIWKDTSVPMLNKNTPAVCNVSTDARSVDVYNNLNVLSTCSDPDMGIVSAVNTSALPPGVGLYSNGSLYVLSASALQIGTFTVNITTTDGNRGQTAITLTITFLGHLCGGQCCVYPGVSNCTNGHICPIGGLNLCGNQCYDPLIEQCVADIHFLVLIGFQVCITIAGPVGYNPLIAECVVVLGIGVVIGL